MGDFTPRRLFTLEEAKSMLGVVRPILLELQRNYAALDELRQEFGQHAARLKRYGILVEGHRLEAEIGDLLARMQDDIEAIHTLGIDLKNIEWGLIDFPAMRDGDVVYLCYRLDEPEIIAWHPIDSGYAGRQPIDDRFNT